MYDFVIRPVDDQDWETVLRVYEQCTDFLALCPTPNPSREMVLQDMQLSRKEGGKFCSIFTPTGEILGVLDYIAAGFAGEKQHAYILLLMISAPYRRGGLGKEVVAWLQEKLTTEEDITALLASVQVNNPEAQRFWLREGFQVAGEPELQPDGTTSILLKKVLKN